VRLVVQGQHIKQKNAEGIGGYDVAFSPVQAASGFRTVTILSLATPLDILTAVAITVDIFQAFVERELLPDDSHNGNV